ncbi:MAG: efflux RND transporter periplasmic adaptor subunit [Thermoanaerobaculia bacterium]
MSDPSEKSPESRSRRSKLRLLSALIGIVIVAVVGVAVMNMVTSKANGADTETTGAEGKDQTEAKDGEEKEGDEEGEEENGKAPVPVEVAQIGVGSVSAYISSTANLVAENDVKVLAEAEGRVATLLVEEGDAIRKGQLLATLVQDDKEIRLKKAQLTESNARLAFERAKDLVEKELISQEEFDKLSIDYEIAGQELAESQWAKDRTEIRSPFTGKVTQRMIQVGQHVQISDELFQVTDFDPLIARIYLPERDIIGLNEGREVRILLNADASVRFTGRIRQISPIVDTATGTVKVTVEANGDTPSQVRPGSFVTINIVRETRADTLLVPREAVIRELQKAHVFIAAGELAVKRDVTLGLEEGDYVEALTGLVEGDQVIVAGQGGLKDGSPVKILGAEEATTS